MEYLDFQELFHLHLVVLCLQKSIQFVPNNNQTQKIVSHILAKSNRMFVLELNTMHKLPFD
ncbi:hypothetical protein T231_03545 [Tannerella sp. oral taxon BU063 isolate Cell 6/7/9]|uniref:Uncharacterized protein n=4 Tax=Tannerella serpentiformis TaxID=712710 RepID=W2CKN6_9BACT|nr:hypothetical protein N425_00495 [Tannerella sp. oral taxon BU063 isolate Cell 2]ETK07015.1 hypothetical protein T230_09395 [Tannerella sp. oral taxon BU063 isolate Cell 1/3]ETK07017.1 hypothetical protein T230_09380 [Tannerella sp. oral taxon BU063 isolate Cell 1/3]ETK10693.1 hypothetical protein T231_03545 [Tannerella sp. oral taxon BU063 isolate Cell 6/7/9]ETK13084.1 hypothetical protein T235_05500 [Tannerella sp. oral taxon BU063 isolate Cell 8/11]